MLDKIVIGPIQDVKVPEAGQSQFLARVDTGAQTSAIWAESVSKEDGRLKVVFFGKSSPLYSGQAVSFDQFARTTVTNSTGVTEPRWKVRLLVEIEGRRVRAWFTLANRSRQMYPVLIGRNVLRGKFVVDIAHRKAGHKANKVKAS